MSSCSRSDSVLSYLMEEMTGQEAGLFEEHLVQCSTCRHELALEQALQRGLEECTHPDAIPSRLRSEILLKLMAMRHPVFPFWQIAATIATGVAALFAVLHVIGDSSLPDMGLGFITGIGRDLPELLGRAGSLPVIFGVGLVMVVIASVVASLVPEE